MSIYQKRELYHSGLELYAAPAADYKGKGLGTCVGILLPFQPPARRLVDVCLPIRLLALQPTIEMLARTSTPQTDSERKEPAYIKLQTYTKSIRDVLSLARGPAVGAFAGKQQLIRLSLRYLRTSDKPADSLGNHSPIDDGVVVHAHPFMASECPGGAEDRPSLPAIFRRSIHCNDGISNVTIISSTTYVMPGRNLRTGFIVRKSNRVLQSLELFLVGIIG